MKKLILPAIVALVVVSCVNKVGLPPQEVAVTPDACDSIKYSVDIQPLLSSRCAVAILHHQISLYMPIQSQKWMTEVSRTA